MSFATTTPNNEIPTSKTPEKESPLIVNPTSISETQTPKDSITSLEKETLKEKRPDGEEEGEAKGVEEGEEEEEEEGECGFCLFMKGGGCKDSFTAWENCIQEAENNKEDIVEKCFQVTSMLKKCMDAHSDYYEPILRAEKAANDEVVKEMEKEKELVDKVSQEQQVVIEIEKEKDSTKD